MKQATNWTVAACLAVFISGMALAQDTSGGTVKPLLSVKFSPDNDVKCLLSSIEAGDPTIGRSTLILKASAGCVVPWHFHTAEAARAGNYRIVDGEMTIEATGQQRFEAATYPQATRPPKGKYYLTLRSDPSRKTRSNRDFSIPRVK